MYTVKYDLEIPESEIAVISIRGFIGDAKEESINMILEFAEAKKERCLNKFFVMGCLTVRYMEYLRIQIPEVDNIYSKFGWEQLTVDLGKSYNQDISSERSITTPQRYIYPANFPLD